MLLSLANEVGFALPPRAGRSMQDRAGSSLPGAPGHGRGRAARAGTSQVPGGALPGGWQSPGDNCLSAVSRSCSPSAPAHPLHRPLVPPRPAPPGAARPAVGARRASRSNTWSASAPLPAGRGSPLAPANYKRRQESRCPSCRLLISKRALPNLSSPSGSLLRARAVGTAYSNLYTDACERIETRFVFFFFFLPTNNQAFFFLPFSPPWPKGKLPGICRGRGGRSGGQWRTPEPHGNPLHPLTPQKTVDLLEVPG